jgi:two-component system phosphate regulon response regulator PhoB
VAGLDPEIGADDFVLMPIIPRELSARLRQLGWRETMGQGGRVIRHGGFVLDCVSLQASYQGEPLKLTPYEFQLLKFMTERAGVVFSREELLTRVWGYRHVGRVRTVDTHILNLRGKLGAAGDLLEAVRGMGYKLRKLENAEEGIIYEHRSIA